MLEVCDHRTRRIKLVVQDVHDPHNVSACIRSADAFGIQDCDVVTLTKPFKPSTVTRGVHKWLTLNAYDSVEKCATNLKTHGYKIVCAMPQETGVSLNDLDPTQNKLAIVFGNEKGGLDTAWQKSADQFFTIPMCGMVESLNISVSCAITLHSLRSKLELGSKPWELQPEEKKHLLSQWLGNQLLS